MALAMSALCKLSGRELAFQRRKTTQEMVTARQKDIKMRLCTSNLWILLIEHTSPSSAPKFWVSTSMGHSQDHLHT